MLRPLRALVLATAIALTLSAPSAVHAATSPTAGAYVGTTTEVGSAHVVVAFDGGSVIDVQTTITTDPDTNQVIVDIVPAPSVADLPAAGGACSETRGTNLQITCDLTPGDIVNGVEYWGTGGRDHVSVDGLDASDTTPVRAYLRDGIAGDSQSFLGSWGDDHVDTVSENSGTLPNAKNLINGAAGVDTYALATDANTIDLVGYADVDRVSGLPHAISADCQPNDGDSGNFYEPTKEDIGCTSSGLDGILGSSGDDFVSGDSTGALVINGGAGDDTINGGGATETIYGGDGGDSMSGGAGTDTFYGDFDYVTLTSGTGDDWPNLRDGGTADVLMACGGGDDLAFLDEAGIDTVDATSSDCERTSHILDDSDGYISLFTFGTPGTERIIFDPSASTLASTVTVKEHGTDPFPGTDIFEITYTAALDAHVEPHAPECGYAPNDGDDTSTRTVLCSPNDWSDAGAFDRGMEVWLGNGNSDFTASANLVAPFLIHPERGVNTVRGGSGNDTFKGNDFPTETTPSNTTNSFHGGLGADTFVGGAGNDFVDYLFHPGPGAAGEFTMTMDCVANDGGSQDGNKGDNVGCSSNGIDGIVGSNHRDVITGDAAANKIYSQNGNDLVNGGDGADHLYGGGDHDHVTGGAGADHIYGDRGATTYADGAAPDGADHIVANDGAADAAIDCGGHDDGADIDLGMDTHANCERPTQPAVVADPTPTTPTPTTPTPTKDPTVPDGWTRGETIPPKTVDFTFPAAAYLKDGTTWEAVLLGLGFSKPAPPDMKMVAKPLSFTQLPDKYQDDDIVPQQFVKLVIKSGAAPGTANTIRWTEGQALPVVEFHYYDATKGAPRNKACPASGEVRAQGGGTINLFRYVETLPLNDALYWLDAFGCRVDSKPALVRVRRLAHAGISNVRSTKVGRQRIVTFTKNVPVNEELRVVIAPDYNLQSTDLTLGVADQGTAEASLRSPLRAGLTTASNTQRIGVHVLEESTGRFVPGARVDLVNEDGKVINSYDGNIARTTKPGPAIGYADKHMRTNDVGYTRLTFKVGKPGTVWVHAWVENPSTGTPLVERWLPITAHDRGKAAFRSLIGVKYEPTGAGTIIDGHLVSKYVMSKKQAATKARTGNTNARVKATGVAIIDGFLALFGALDDNSSIQTGAPGAAKAGTEGERILSQDKPAQTLLAEIAASGPAGKAAVWDGGGTAALVVKNGIVGNAGGNMVAAGGGNIVAAGAGNIVAAGGGNMVAAGGGNIVAAGAGNMVAAGGGNIVAAGAGNMVAAGGGNMVAAGGLNMVAAGGLNRYRHGISVDWVQRLRMGRSAASGSGTSMPSVPVNVIWIDDDTSVLVGSDGTIPDGTIIHTQGRGVPVNYPGAS